MNAAHTNPRRATTTILHLACALAIQAIAAPPPDPLIAAARAAAAAYRDSLPDYIAKRTTARYRGTRAALWQPASAIRVWTQADTVTGEVTAVHSKEVYSNITINGMPAAELPNWGSWSAGEFATALLAILPPERSAAFTHRHAVQLRNRAAVRYDFAVDRSHSAWRLATDRLPGSPGPQTYVTAYTGAMWIDKQTGQALRIEMSARSLPGWFALNSIESDTDFDFVQIGDRSYLLPERSDSLTCERSGHICLKNETVFTNYDKFVSSTNIFFGDPHN